MKHRLLLSSGFLAAATFGRLGFRHFPEDEPSPTPTPTPGTPPPAPPAPPSAPPAIGSKGELPEGWHLNFGDEFGPHADQAKQFKDAGSLFRSYVNLRKTGPAYPGEAATPDDIARFRTLAQVPDDVAGYGITKPDGFTGDWDDNLVSAISAAAHKGHVPAAGLKGIVEAFNAHQTAQAQAQTDELARMSKEAEDKLVGKWRGDYQGNLSTVRHVSGRIAEQLGIAKEDPAFVALTEHPMFREIMFQVSKIGAEDSVRANGFQDLRSAQQRMDAITNGTDPEWGKKYNEGDPAAYEVWKNLYNEVHGSK